MEENNKYTVKQKSSNNGLLMVLTFFVGVLVTLITYKIIPQNITQTTSTINEGNKKVTVIDTSSLNESINKIYDSVVLVETYSNSQVVSTGTGFVYKTDDKYGYIITNNHVISGGDTYNIKYIDETATEGTIVASDEYTDIAVIKVAKDTVKQVAIIGKSDDSKIGDTLFTVGSPMGATYMGTVTRGILSGKDRVVEVSIGSGAYYMEVLQTDAAINPGNSGGPLVNLNGEVIGVNSLKLVQDEIEGMGFAIPIETVMEVVTYLEQGKEIERPVLGVKVIDITNKIELYLRYNIRLDDSIKEGVYLYEIEKNSLADKGGLKKGDIIIQVDGKKVTSSGYFKYLLYSHKDGDLKLVVYRNGNLQDINIKLKG